MQSIEQQYYENPAFWDAAMFTEDDHRRLAFVAAHVPTDAKTLCDVGCGNGLFLKFLSQEKPQLALHGVDRSVAALRHVGVAKTQASITELPFEDRQFDCVSCLEVIEHLPEAAYQLALHELTRISGRHLIISVPRDQDLTLGQVQCTACKTRFNPDYHFRSYSETDMAQLLSRFGFRATGCVAYGGVSEFAFAKAITRLKRDLSNRFPVDIPCPACGHVLQARAAASGAGAAPNRKTIKDAVKAVWPKVTVPRWLLAVYERDAGTPS